MTSPDVVVRKPWYVIVGRGVALLLFVVAFPLVLVYEMGRILYLSLAYGLSAKWPGEDE